MVRWTVSMLAVLFLVGPSTARADLCEKCRDGIYPAQVGPCQKCRGMTASGVFALCGKCSKNLTLCERCKAFLSGKPEDSGPSVQGIVLTQESDGKTVTVSHGLGAMISIRLSGNPTTGYSWTGGRIVGGTLTQVGTIAYEAGKPQLIGSGGTFIARFKTVKPGKSVIKLEYRRSWEKNVPAIKTFTVTVEVRK